MSPVLPRFAAACDRAAPALPAIGWLRRPAPAADPASPLPEREGPARARPGGFLLAGSVAEIPASVCESAHRLPPVDGPGPVRPPARGSDGPHVPCTACPVLAPIRA